MTIALGFPYDNGVIVAADSQFTSGDAKIYGQKTGTIEASWGQAIVAFAGNVNLAAGAFQECERNKEDSQFKGSPVDGFGHFFYRHYQDHVFPKSKEDRDDFNYSLLLGVHLNGQPKSSMYRVSDGALRQIDNFECVGIGDVFGRSALASLPTKHVDHSQAISVCSYALSYAKERAEFCGGPSCFKIIEHDGKVVFPEDYQLLADRAAHAEYVGNWFIQECERFLIFHNDGDMRGFTEMMKLLEARMIHMRNVWDSRSARAGLPSRLSPKPDSSHLPPWPE